MAVRALPIWAVHPEIVQTLQSDGRLVLVAPTGSGKTTQVPQMLLEAGMGPGKIVVLQPRRVAARSVAGRVAQECGTRLGELVGYQIRFDDQTSLGTRICFVTEGILLRWLQSDPMLSEVTAILFDEFHERNLLSDVALACAKRLQATRRPDLRIAVMSATLEAEPVANYLGDCRVIVSEGRLHPVTVEYLGEKDERPIHDQAADAVERILRDDLPGDILIFMPGMGEINATLSAIRSLRAGEKLALIPLHGELPPGEQDMAFAPSELRKVVVSTNVAETSVTIDGIRHVIDSGLARVGRFDGERGLHTLFVEPISRASAEQRRGRAGRTAPGNCVRLWTESGHLNRPEKNTPEIQRSDLAEVVLLLHSVGVKKASDFDWLDRPDPVAVDRADQLLVTLGAVEEASGDLTEVGRQMLKLPMHPRYSRMLVEAARGGCVEQAALCAALVSGRDLLVRLGRDEKHISEARELFEGSDQSDFYTLIRAFQFARKNDFAVERCRRYGIHAQVARQVEQTYEQIRHLARTLPGGGSGSGDEALLRSIAAGFVDQLCVRRDMGTLECDMMEGRTGTLMRESVVQNARLLVAAGLKEIDRHGTRLTLIGLATAVRLEWLEEMFPQNFSVAVEHLYDRTHKRVAAVRMTRLRGLVIAHKHESEVDAVASGKALAQAYARGYYELPLLNHQIKQWIARVHTVRAVMPELDLPAMDPASIQDILAQAFAGLTLAKEAQAADLRTAFRGRLAESQWQWVDEMVPATLAWTDGKPMKLLYPEEGSDQDGDPASPEVQVRLADCFSLQHHPHVCEGRLPVKLWLATPDGKRLESTFNWPGFRKVTYPKLRTALQKKFPGLLWP